MARAPQPRPDPTRDAASLLRRLGFAVLLVGLPIAALAARRGPVTILPIGVFLLVVAASLDAAIRPLREVADGLLSSSGMVALAFALGWAVLSLAWTPDPGAAAERLVAIAGVLAVGFVGYVVLPERMRAANLYLVPVGCTAGALAIIAAMLLVGSERPDMSTDGRSLERGVCALLLALWPSLAWLRSRERDLEALTLAILAATATLMAAATTTLPLALGAGAVAYALVTLAPAAATTLLAGTTLLCMLLPAALPFVDPSWLSPVEARAPALAAGLRAWSSEAAADPARLLTGHGFSAQLASRIAGSVPPQMPRSVPIQLWYDLGLVGVLAGAAALWFGLRAAIVAYAPLLPGVAAAYATGFALACLGIGIGQSWWIASVVAVALAFVAAERGQFRTRRPRARLFAAARDRA